MTNRDLKKITTGGNEDVAKQNISRAARAF